MEEHGHGHVGKEGSTEAPDHVHLRCIRTC